MIIEGMTEDLSEVALRDLAPLEPLAVAIGAAVPSLAADGSPSRDRLVRIAAMIRDAERAMPVPTTTRHRRAHEVRLIPLAPRRSRAHRRAEAVAELAS